MTTEKKPLNDQNYQDELVKLGFDKNVAAEIAARTTSKSVVPASTSSVSTALKTLTTTTTIPQGTNDLFGTGDGDDGEFSEDSGSSIIIAGRQSRLLKASQDIHAEAPSGNDISFMHTIMCQVGLPRSKVHGTEFERMCGAVALSVSAGKLFDGKKWVQQEVPYGAYPRLMIAWMNTYAIKHRTPVIPLGSSASDFLRELGKNPNGGARGAFTTLRKQTNALATCRLTLGFAANGRAITYDGKPVKQFEAWLQTDDEQPSLWPGVLEYSQEYYNTLIDHAVPLDERALRALGGSALEMDIYAWLAERLHRLQGRGVNLHWANLRDQFGQEYKGKDPDKDFKKKFVPALENVLKVYPAARVKQVRGGILLLPSHPPVPYKTS